jgi:uncharacterized alkaline shock family protein YloU
MANLDRVFLGLIAVILVLTAGLLTATILGNYILVDWLQSPGLLFDGGILAVILLLLALYLIVLVTRHEPNKFIVYERELGAVKISADCVQGLIIEAARELPGLEDVIAKITDVEEPKVSLKIRVYPDYNIPQLSEELQQSVKDYVENTVGVTIREVEVSVVGISNKAESNPEPSL